jgi:RHH-type proline utilization regulon transcriptional repressor/proline dehydrogenase/delta 1-pyrroline-5-carboxylate dehydrogenase
VLLVPKTEAGLYRQVTAALATGNRVSIDSGSGLAQALSDVPTSVAARIAWVGDWAAAGPFAGALVEGDAEQVRAANASIAALPGPLVLVQSASSDEIAAGSGYSLNWLLEEVSTSINTAAAGGNASLMSIG